MRAKASWRSGYAEDCKSLHPGSIPGEASIAIPIFDFAERCPLPSHLFTRKLSTFSPAYSPLRQVRTNCLGAPPGG